MRKGKKFNNRESKLHILVAPLDWGLGHITRCIPIVTELIRLDCNVTLAASKEGVLLLKNEFPGVQFLYISGYKVKYSRNKRWLSVKLISQLPKILWCILKENNWLKKVVNNYAFDAVISDNRLGMYNSTITSIYVTHQLAVKSGTYISDKISSRIHRFFIKKFTECWVPDFKENGLAGKLSHIGSVGSNIKYMGTLSRFEELPGISIKYDLLICISGPEPQRKIFEEIILSQLKHYVGRTLLVRGLPAEKEELISSNNSLEIVNHLSGNDLNKAFQQSKYIICRSGYTTIMDLIKIGKQAILIPTPGQTEQEYLAEYLMEKRYFYSIKQTKFSLSKALSEASGFPFINDHEEMEGYKKVIIEFILSLKKDKFATQ